jgi:alcohol dehydrogenase class IV
LLGAHLAGLALTLSGLGLVHGIAHSVSAHVGAAHGEALAAVLPEVMTFNSEVAADVYASVAVDLGELASATATTAIDRIRGLADDINIRFPLSSFGVTQPMIGDISSKVVVDSVTSNNPIMPTVEEVALILTGRL